MLGVGLSLRRTRRLILVFEPQPCGGKKAPCGHTGPKTTWPHSPKSQHVTASVIHSPKSCRFQCWTYSILSYPIPSWENILEVGECTPEPAQTHDLQLVLGKKRRLNSHAAAQANLATRSSAQEVRTQLRRPSGQRPMARNAQSFQQGHAHPCAETGIITIFGLLRGHHMSQHGRSCLMEGFLQKTLMIGRCFVG